MELKRIYNRINEGLRTTQGRNILTFFVFLAISTVFWLLLALNDDVQKDYSLPVELENFPEDVTMISGYRPVLNVTIKDKGAVLMKYSWGGQPSVKLSYDDFSQRADSVLYLTPQKLNSAVRSLFGNTPGILAIRPDSLQISYTTNPGVRVAIAVDGNIRTLPQYAYSGHPLCSTDSVTIYSNSPSRYNIRSIQTKPVVLADLTDTTSVDVALKIPKGFRAIPSEVKVTFPVEPLVAKQQMIPIEVVNVPAGEKVVTFPAMTEVSYLLPKSMYKGENARLRVMVDYNDIHRGETSVPLSIMKLPTYVRNASLNPATVDFVIERSH